MLQPRISLSRTTVKELQARLEHAYTRGDVRLVRRISVLLDYLAHGLVLADITAHWHVSPASVYNWLRGFLTQGFASLAYHHGGGRPSKLTPTQKQKLCTLLDGGPQAAGFEPGCWSTLLIQQLIQQEFKVVYNRFYVGELLHNLGYTYQKARFVSDHLDEAKRQAWLTQEWPKILQAARACGALILFGDEASFPQWGTLSYTWARKGQQPTVKTSGRRKGYKVFGLIEYFSGRFFHEAIEGRFASASYQAFLLQVLEQTTEHLFIIQDGAKYHTSQATREFLAAHRDRITACQLPSYSPDYNPIEYLWHLVKQDSTHCKYFAEFAELMATVDKALVKLAQHPEIVLNLFTRYSEATGLAAQAAEAMGL
jgi:transposase